MNIYVLFCLVVACRCLLLLLADTCLHPQELEEHTCAVCAVPGHAPPGAAHDCPGGAAGYAPPLAARP